MQLVRTSVLFLIAGAAVTVRPASLPEARPEAAGMSSERLKRIGGWLNGMVERREAAGFVALVARHGKVVHHKAYGTRGLDARDPMPVDRYVEERILAPLGMAVVTNPGASGLPYSKGSYYWSGSQGTIFWVDPALDLVGVLMVQVTPNRLRLRRPGVCVDFGMICCGNARGTGK